MKEKKLTHEQIHKITLVGILTALAIVLAAMPIPGLAGSPLTLILPVIVITGAICNPWVAAWITVIPSIIYTFRDAQLFLPYSPFGCILTMIAKGLLAGFISSLIYKMIAKKHPRLAVFTSSALAPVINSGVFLIGAYLFFWGALENIAFTNNVSMVELMLGLVGINFATELVINIILCPTILRIINIGKKESNPA